MLNLEAIVYVNVYFRLKKMVFQFYENYDMNYEFFRKKQLTKLLVLCFIINFGSFKFSTSY